MVNLRLPPEVFEATKERAEREERTASAVIRRALKQHLDEPDQDQPRG
jgi:predicted DNA-binding protein